MVTVVMIMVGVKWLVGKSSGKSCLLASSSALLPSSLHLTCHCPHPPSLCSGNDNVVGYCGVEDVWCVTSTRD